MTDQFDDPHLVMHDDKSLFWVRPLEVNADGARNAYHRDDPHGSKGLAIEYIGNGMTIYRRGEALEFHPNEADNEVWLEAYQRIVDNHWRAPPGYTIDIYGFARDEDDVVCTKNDGRLISSTSLVQYPRLSFCNPKRYVDALALPGIVVPNRADNERPVAGADREIAPPFARVGVARGDLAVVYNPETQIWKGAFIYDTGPRQLLGEGSLRLVMDLRNTQTLPTSGFETNAMGIVQTFVVVFPGTAKELGSGNTWTQEKIEGLATSQFKAWGGGSIDAALDKMFVCAESYKSKRSSR